MTPRAKGLGHGPVTGPNKDMLPGWRAACLAYREEMIAKNRNGGEIWRKVDAAFREAMPEMDPKEASDQATRAIHWASVYHTAWLYSREQ